MATSCIAVKGQQFADVALGSFECMQIIEILAIISSSDGDIGEEELEQMVESASATLGTIMLKMARGMSQEDREAAARFGDQMMNRKLELQQRLNGL